VVLEFVLKGVNYFQLFITFKVNGKYLSEELSY
jgi:hypothetical protein